MAQKQYIKYLYEVEDKSLREISRITGHSFETVKKYAYQTDWSEDHLPDVKPSHYPVLGDYIPIIDDWLEADKKIPRKQRHTAWRIYCRLRDEHGFPGSYSSVKKYVQKKKYVMRKTGPGYIPLESVKGAGQVDFGESIYIDENAHEKKGYALTISFVNSNKGYTQFFPSQNQECLLEGMKRIFEYIGGVPPILRFDNMSTAVVHILEGPERKLTDGFTRFMLHYRFQAEFCNPASGNEKGNVENKVGYSRRNAFVPIPEITSFEEFNEKLFAWCEEDGERNHYIHGIKINELWKEDKAALLALPQYPFEVFRYTNAVVGKTGLVTIDTNKYSVSPELFGKTVQAKIYQDHIEFFYHHEKIAAFERSYEKGKTYYDWRQYAPILYRKPRAVEHAKFFSQMPELWQKHLVSIQGNEKKDALELLRDIVLDGNDSLCDETLEMAYAAGRTDADSLRQCYYMITKREYHPAPLRIDNAITFSYNPDITAYDSLIGGKDHE